MFRDIIFGDNLKILKTFPAEFADLVYIDPPFNTQRRRQKTTLKVIQSPNGTRKGFQGKSYISSVVYRASFDDSFENYISFMYPRLVEAYRILKFHGSLFIHLDYHEVHYIKIVLDRIFGCDNFMNEIIWAYDYGGRSKRYWPRKHDNILWYVKNKESYIFNEDEFIKIPYIAPSLTTPGSFQAYPASDVWWHTIVPTKSAEKTGYPAQKPLGILKRIIQVHSRPGDLVLDFFAGSGTTGEAAAQLGRQFILIDNNPEAICIMMRRLKEYKPRCINCKELPCLTDEYNYPVQPSLFGN